MQTFRQHYIRLHFV